MSKDHLPQNSQIPKISNQSKSKIISAASKDTPCSPSEIQHTKKRLFSQTTPPSPNSLEHKAKQVKMKQEDLDATLDRFFNKLQKENQAENERNRLGN